MLRKFILRRSFSVSKFSKQNADKAKSNKMTNESLQSVRPKNWEKYVLIYSKKYKSIAEVPERVSASTLDKAKSIVRIKLANIVMVLMAVGCLGFVIAGKKQAERGDTSIKVALDYKEKYLSNMKKEEGIQIK